MLRRHGYQTVEAEDVADALSVLDANDGAVGLVVSDYSIPGVNGADLIKRLKAEWPGVPVLLMSGEANAAECGAGDGFLAKPFGPLALLNAVRELCA
jgi:DNA-binding response OmpR family regulator